MKAHNAIQFYPELLKSLGKLVGLGELEDGVFRISETLQPVLDAWSLPEAAFLRNEFLWIGDISRAAQIGLFSHVGVQNPAGSGLLITVSGWIQNTNVGPAGAVFLRYRNPAGPFTSRQTSFFRDSRFGFGGGCPVQILEYDNAAIQGAGPGATFGSAAAGTASIIEQVPHVLAPDNDLLLVPSTNNTAIEFTFFGTARRLLPRELP